MHKDKFGTRLTKAKSNPGKYNWLFLAGGPGADSQYLNELIECLKVPGQLWRVDLPENGSNQLSDTYLKDYDFEKWEPALRFLLKSIDNPILVGHSFSGLYPLLFPEIENDLRGLVLLNSATRPWIENAMKMAKIKNLPSFEKEMAEFLSNKSDETFAKARKIFYHYYFNPDQLEKGTKILSRAPFNYHASCWWLTKAPSIDFDNLLIPSIPTLIIGGSEDSAVPFQRDERYLKANIKIHEIKGASHFPWLDNPEEVNRLFNDFLSDVK